MVLVHYGPFPQDINQWSWHQIMLISLFPTPFDHFHFHPTLELKSRVILRSCHTNKYWKISEMYKMMIQMKVMVVIIVCMNTTIHFSSSSWSAEIVVTVFIFYLFWFLFPAGIFLRLLFCLVPWTMRIMISKGQDTYICKYLIVNKTQFSWSRRFGCTVLSGKENISQFVWFLLSYLETSSQSSVDAIEHCWIANSWIAKITNTASQ